MIHQLLIQKSDFYDSAGGNLSGQNRIKHEHLDSNGNPEVWEIIGVISESIIIRKLSDNSISYYWFKSLGKVFKYKER